MKKNQHILSKLSLVFLCMLFGTACTAKVSETTSDTKESVTSVAKSEESSASESVTESASKSSESDSSTNTSESDSSMEKNMAAYKDLDYVNEWIMIWAKVDTAINDLGDVYEIKDVCLAKSVSYEYTPDMFENVKVGERITLPNGEFILTEVDMYETGEGKSTSVIVDNEYFSQYFDVRESEVTPYGIGTYIQLESVYIGDVYVAKDAKFSTFSEENPDEIIEMSFKEGVAENEEYRRYGFYLSVLDMDEEGVIQSVERPYIP